MDMAKANVNRGRRFSALASPNPTGEEEGEPISRPNRDLTSPTRVLSVWGVN